MKLTLRIWILIICLLLAVLMISPSFKSGVVIKGVDKNTSASNSGLTTGMIITQVNGQSIKNLADYTQAVQNVLATATEDTKFDIKTTKDEFIFLDKKAPEIEVADVPSTKIKTGLDLSGGARALVKAVNVTLTSSQLQDLVAVTNQRLNTFGLSDVVVKGATDLEGNSFMIVEVAGASPADLKDLVGKQGNFEAKVGNVSVFGGGDKDIADVCRNDAACSGVTGCFQQQTGYACNFKFTIYLTENAAKKHADVTRNLPLDDTGKYLSEKLFLYIDGKEVDSLLIGAELRGQVATQIAIQGSGQGATQEAALADARASMSKLQTVLITGGLPFQLEIVKLDTISPSLGKDFIRVLLIAGAFAILAVGIIIFARYRKVKASLALLLTSFSEIVIILGVAAFLKWNLDLPSIAGILATIGTGVDAQIVIMDEAESGRNLSLKEKMKRALFVIFTSYATAVVSLIPLWWAGAGLFKGFAFTTIIGVTSGILITRPAFADMIKMIKGE